MQPVEPYDFLPVLRSDPRGGCSQWNSGDTKAAFRHNCATQPAAWPWRHRSVGYTVNLQGYRCPEFDQIDWARSLVIFGCSHVFGVGVDDADTISSQLAALVNRPVINMGVGGSSILCSWHNLLCVLRRYGAPAGVIMGWTDLSRLTTFHANGDTRHLGPWTDADQLWRSWAVQSDCSDVWARSVKHSWDCVIENLGVGSAEFTHWQATAELLGVKYFPLTDRARDLSHPGPASHRAVARYLAEQYEISHS